MLAIGPMPRFLLLITLLFHAISELIKSCYFKIYGLDQSKFHTMIRAIVLLLYGMKTKAFVLLICCIQERQSSVYIIMSQTYKAITCPIFICKFIDGNVWFSPERKRRS